MTELATTGIWMVNPTKEVEFIEAWTAFAAWASAMPGAGPLRLGRDTGNPLRFVSSGAWESTEAVRAWKSQPEFRTRIAQVLQFVDDFHPTELDIIAVCTNGTSTSARAMRAAL